MYSEFESKIIYQMFLRVFTPEGTLKSAEKRLSFLQSLGIDYIYLCPCFVADDDMNQNGWSKRQIESGYNNPCNPYRIKDYFDVDPEYGTLEDLRSFINTAHSLGMKVLLDLVYFHCGPNAVFIKDNPDFVRRLPNGNIDCGEWNFPILNFDNPKLREYLWSNMEWYVRKFDVDGYRCDVAEKCPIDFWREGVKRIKKIKKDIFMLDEGNKPLYMEETFDASYLLFWPKHMAVKDVFLGNEPAKTMQEISAVTDIPYGKAHIRALDTHDTICDSTQRYEVRAGHAAANAALVFNFCADGIPFLYNGDEIADTNTHSIFSNRLNENHKTVNWSRAETPDGKERIELIKRLCEMRHNVPALYKGNIVWKYGLPESVMAFTRRTNGSKIIAVFNTGNNQENMTFNISVSNPLLSDRVDVDACDSCLKLSMKPKGYYVAEFFDK